MAISTIRPDDEQDPLTQGNAIKPAARNPGASIPGMQMPTVRAIPRQGDGTNPLTKIVAALPAMRDQHGNDMTATNKMKAQLGEAPVGTAPATPAPQQVAEAPAVATQPAPTPIARDQYGNDMTRTNAMKAQLGEAPIGTPAPNPLTANNPGATIPGIDTSRLPLATGQVPTISGRMNPNMQAVINAQPHPVLTGLLSDKQTYPDITGRRAQQSAVPSDSPVAPPAVSPIAEASKSSVPPALSAVVQEPVTLAPQGQSVPASNPLVSPTSPNAVTTPQVQQPGAVNPAEGQKQTSFTEVGQATAPTQGPVDAHGNSMAATNEMKAKLDELTSTAPANVTTLENSGLKESQELMDKWGRQDMQREMLQEMGRNPRAANAIAGLAANANNTETQMRGQDVAAQVNQRNTETTQRGQDLTAETTRRGQDVHATVEGNRLAGNPLENKLKSVQIQAGQGAIDRAAAQDKAIADIRAETDPVKRQSMIDAHLASRDKNPLTDRYIKLSGGEETRLDGTRVKNPDQLFEVATRQAVPLDGQPQNPRNPKVNFTQADYESTAKKYGMTIEQVKAVLANQQGAK